MVKFGKKLGTRSLLAMYLGFGVLGILLCGYGYAAVSQDLLIEGRGQVLGNVDIRNVEVRVLDKTEYAGEAYNAEYSSSSASFYPEIDGKNEQITYAVKTCNYSKNKTFELTGLDEPATAIGSLESKITNIEVGTSLVLGTKLVPGECAETIVSFMGTKNDGAVSGAMTLDYVWEEYEGVPFSIEYMQDMTPQVCAATSSRETKQLVDKRDGKKYWVTKMHDGNCWMAQDLDYDGGGDRFMVDDLDGWSQDASGSPLQYVYTGDNEKGHESDGSYYSYMAAMGVCPKGWRLATGGDGGEWDVLLNVAGLNDISERSEWWERAAEAPFYLRMTGYAARRGVYSSGVTRTGWTSTRSSISSNTNTSLSLAWGEEFSKNIKYSVKMDEFTSYGQPARCIAKNGNDAQVKELLTTDTMQELTATICEASQEGDAKQLIDERDGKTYWVTKLPDGKCWMTQNLDYDGGGTKFDANSDMNGWIHEGGSNPAQYYYGNDNEKGRKSDGSYYSYKAALNVCPVGWRLPASGSDGDYVKLFGSVNLGNTGEEKVRRLQGAPYYFRSSGILVRNKVTGYDTEGDYRAARSAASPAVATFEFLYGSLDIDMQGDDLYFGESVRCVLGDPVQEPVDIYSIETMQELTPELCKVTGVYDYNSRRRLTDTRDGHRYWVTKLSKDGNCWMAQNLDYDGGGDVRFDSNSDISKWDISQTTNPSQYYYNGDWSENLSYGSWYSWTAAQNVCPVGWKLPTSNEQQTVWNGLTAAQLAAWPYSYVYAGRYSNTGLWKQDDRGFYWSSTFDMQYNDGWLAVMNGTINQTDFYDDLGYYGASVRCMMLGH